MQYNNKERRGTREHRQENTRDSSEEFLPRVVTLRKGREPVLQTMMVVWDPWTSLCQMSAGRMTDASPSEKGAGIIFLLIGFSSITQS